MDSLLGQFAALGASVSFSLTSTMFTLAGRKFAPILVMRSSLPIGFVLVLIIHWFTTGQMLPFDAGERWFWLGLSGIIGFWLASVAIVNAFILIGPRLSLLIAASAPILSSLLAWIFLDETLETPALLGITLTISGIIWVVTDKGQNISDIPPEKFRLGIMFAFAAASGQALGFVLSKQGLEGDFNPLSGSLIRITVATFVLWFIAVFRGKVLESLFILRDNPQAFRHLSVGAVAGPVIGASLVLVALDNAPVGIASTLSNLMPIFLIPIGYVVFKERITRRAIAGTLIAVAGTAILFL